MDRILIAGQFDGDAHSAQFGFSCGDELVTDQSQKEDADINTIVRRFGLGDQNGPAARPVFYADFSDVVDFQTAMNAVAAAGEAFDAMPAAVRARFENNPQKFLEFCEDANNMPELEKLGLLKPEGERSGRAKANVGAAAASSDGGVAGDSSAVGSGQSGGQSAAGRVPGSGAPGGASGAPGGASG